jgi:hypothetical protein
MGGPGAHSQLGVVELVERVTNRKLALEYLSLEQIERALQATADPLKQSYLGLYRGLALGDVPTADWASEFGLTPTRLEACIERMWEAQGARARLVDWQKSAPADFRETLHSCRRQKA